MYKRQEPTKAEWPPNPVPVFKWRQQELIKLRKSEVMLYGAKAFYGTRPVDFICDWVDTYDPRLADDDMPMRLPFQLFDRQKDLVEFLLACIKGKAPGLIEKCRDAGATWVCCGFSVWLWLYMPGASVGWGSRKEDLVDKMGDPDSIFEKMRMIIDGLPAEFLPHGFAYAKHCRYMKIINPENGATITGEGGDNIGRGGRKLIYFKDESAHYERPEKIEAALSANTNVPIDISSVNGLGNVFHRKRESGIEWEGGEANPKRANVFVFDYRDHPAKDEEWYERQREKAEAEGLLHIFAQEVERNYAAAVEGVVIPAEWVKSAIGAAEKLGFDGGGAWFAALDVADEGRDTNAWAARKGVILKDIAEWAARDTGVTARNTVERARVYPSIDVQYDVIGVGAGVKSEINRLNDEEALPRGVNFVAWDAGASPLNPDDNIIPDDPTSMINKDFFENLKAQGWWELRRRFEKTHNAVKDGVDHPVDELISICPDLPKLRQLEKELSQPTMDRSKRGKLLINKTPEGTNSPNLADSVMMAFWPLDTGYDSSMDWL